MVDAKPRYFTLLKLFDIWYRRFLFCEMLISCTVFLDYSTWYLLNLKKRLYLNIIRHCLKNTRIQSFSGPYFSTFGLNTDWRNSEHRHVSWSVNFISSTKTKNSWESLHLLFIIQSSFLKLPTNQESFKDLWRIKVLIF